MRIQIIIFLFFVTPIAYGQYMSGPIDPKAIIENGVISCTEWHDNQEGITFYFNELGKISYYHFKSTMIDSLGNHIETNNGLRRLEYDKRGNEILTEMSEFVPELDTVFIYSIIKSYYSSDDLLTRKEYFDSPEDKPTVRSYYYDKGSLLKEEMVRPEFALIVNTGKRIKVDSTIYTYDNLKRPISIHRYEEDRLKESQTIEYSGDTAKYKIWVDYKPVESDVFCVKDIFGRMIAIIEVDKNEHRWYYKENGLLDRMEYLYYPINSKRVVLFTYEYKR